MVWHPHVMYWFVLANELQNLYIAPTWKKTHIRRASFQNSSPNEKVVINREVLETCAAMNVPLKHHGKILDYYHFHPSQKAWCQDHTKFGPQIKQKQLLPTWEEFL